MKTWLISDTHGEHNKLKQPQGCSLVIHAGDESNYQQPYLNEHECRKFLDWFSKLDIPHKIMIAGNHSAAIEKKQVTRKEIEDMGIHYLEHEYLEIMGKKFFGSPYSPTFGNWYFMKSRETIGRYWEDLESGIDVLITHGPPRGILDVTSNQYTEHVGDSALYKKIQKVKPRFSVFGHIHNNLHGDINAGTFIPSGSSTTYCNASVVRDGEIGSGVINDGIIIEL